MAACLGCGTEFSPVEAAAPSPKTSRRALMILGLVGLTGSGIAVVIMPALVVAVPLWFAFDVPIWLPFLVSFFIKGAAWSGMRWSLRVGSAAAFFIRLDGMSNLPSFGNDVAGNLAGASHNFALTWGGGLSCAFVAVIVGLLWRAIYSLRLRGRA
jgi:hypothetical protein